MNYQFKFLKALNHRNYRLFAFGQIISLIGSWMQRVALGWLVYRLTNSDVILGTVNFVSQLPILLLALFAGVLADNFNKHRLVITTQVLAMLQASTLAFLCFTNLINIPWIITLGIFLGVVNAFDMTIRQSFTIDMLDDKKDLTNAIAINSFIINGSRIIGPMIAGYIIASFDEKYCFLLNAISYMAVIYGLKSMKIAKTDITSQNNTKHSFKLLNVFSDIFNGIKYLKEKPILAHLLLLLMTTSIFGASYQVLMPIYVKTVLHSNADTLGHLMGAAGIGAIFGAIFLANRKTHIEKNEIEVANKLIKNIPIAAFLFGFGVILLGVSTNSIFAFISLIIVGLGMMVQASSTNSTIQHLVDNHMRGRVMSFYTISFMGTMPIGGFIGGILSQNIGISKTFLVLGGSCVLAALIFIKSVKKP